MNKHILTGLILLTIMAACGKDLPELQGIDLVTWQQDKDGCGGKRAGMIGPLEQEKEKLLALTEEEIVHVLGTPDQRELYSRNEKFYFYSIDASASCGRRSTPEARLVIRFNAMGLAKEVRIDR